MNNIDLTEVPLAIAEAIRSYPASDNAPLLHQIRRYCERLKGRDPYIDEKVCVIADWAHTYFSPGQQRRSPHRDTRPIDNIVHIIIPAITQRLRKLEDA